MTTPCTVYIVVYIVCIACVLVLSHYLWHISNGMENNPTFPMLLQSGAHVCVRKETGGHFWMRLFHHVVFHCWLHYWSSERSL